MSRAWFRQSAVLLLLSKLDVMEKKLSRSPVRQYFPDYIGAQDDSNAAQRFFVNKFLTIGDCRDSRTLLVRCINLMDMDSSRTILEDIQESILAAALALSELS